MRFHTILFLVMTLSVSSFAQKVCESEYFASLDYEVRCVACGIQESNMAKALPSPAWLTLLSLVAQKYHLPEKATVEQRKKKLIQLVGAYGVCFNPGYQVRNRPDYWERLSAGRRGIASVSNDEKENDFWQTFGLRFDQASLGGLFGCDEEKGCTSGLKHFFQKGAENWDMVTPTVRQEPFRKALKSRFNDKLRTHGPVRVCLNQVNDQMDESVNGVNGAFNFADGETNRLNINFCQTVARRCGIDKSFCMKDWRVEPRRDPAQTGK